MSLAPDLLLDIVELQALDATVQDFEPAHIIHVVPLGFAVGEENFKRLIEVNQVESNAVRTALFVTRVNLTKLL